MQASANSPDQLSYHAINVAFLQLADGKPEGRTSAQKALEYAHHGESALWKRATQGEAQLMLDNLEAAAIAYTKALSHHEFRHFGWINRETEWEHRLYGVKRAVILPYFVVTDRQLELRGYPRSRFCDATDVKIHAQSGRVVDELATRISYDLMHTYLSDRKPIAHSAF